MELQESRDWIKQKLAIPAWVAYKARIALEPRVASIESADLPTLPARRVTPLLREGDAESDAVLPGVYYLRVCSSILFSTLSTSAHAARKYYV